MERTVKAPSDNQRRFGVAGAPQSVREASTRIQDPQYPKNDGLRLGRKDEIEKLAYTLFERGGRQDGHDLEHWLEAENQIERTHGRHA